MKFNSFGGKYSGVLTKSLKNGKTGFYVKYRDINSKSVRKRVGVSPDMTKGKAHKALEAIKEEIAAKKDLEKNPNSPIPKILRKKIDKQIYTLNDLADFYFFEHKTKSSREMQNKYNYHFSNEAFASKNIHLISENDIEDFMKRKAKQRADNRRSNSTNITKLHEQGSLPKRKRKSRAINLTLEEREREEYNKNLITISKLESIIASNQGKETWREENKIKLLKEKNKILSYRICPEAAELLLKDKTLDTDKLNALRGILSRKSVKELILLANTIITYANKHKKLNIVNLFNITKGDELYMSVNNVKPRYLTKDEIQSYLKEVKKVTIENPKIHNYL